MTERKLDQNPGTDSEAGSVAGKAGDARPEDRGAAGAPGMGPVPEVVRIAELERERDEYLDSLQRLKAEFGGVYIANEGFNATSAQEALDAGWADAVAFGKAFIANPDLPERLRAGATLNAPQPATFYATGPEGYTDYPSLQLQGVG